MGDLVQYDPLMRNERVSYKSLILMFASFADRFLYEFNMYRYTVQPLNIQENRCPAVSCSLLYPHSLPSQYFKEIASPFRCAFSWDNYWKWICWWFCHTFLTISRKLMFCAGFNKAPDLFYYCIQYTSCTVSSISTVKRQAKCNIVWPLLTETN